ncbi:MAG TPA: CoA transferase, partial [Acidimicrobiales bacterium]|nr:CoA transferase [Acidimicrobiales bacterium]
MGDDALLSSLWGLLDGPAAALDHVTVTGPPQVLPSVFDVTGWATATVGAATLAVAELLAARCGVPFPPVEVDGVSASAAFLAEALFRPDGWERPPIWDPVAGDYEAADGWIRLHTNYAHHRESALRVLGASADRTAVGARVATWNAADLETEVVAAGGCAAAMRTRAEWERHEHGRVARREPPVAIHRGGTSAGVDARHALRIPTSATTPLAGLRVLDLTRVIAGPECTRFLAAWGADVLRIDPPGFAEVPSLLPETTAGKRCAYLDLRARDGAARFEDLARESDVIVSGLRPGALDALGFGDRRLRELNPAVVVARVDAYGWDGPWCERRGFDSLVQMSTGIAARG